MIIDLHLPVAFFSVLKQAFEQEGKDKLAQEIVNLLNEQTDFKLAYTIRDAINKHITDNS